MSAYPRTNESSCHPVPTSLHRDIKPSLESFIFWQAVSDLSPAGQGWRRQPSTPAPASSRRHAARLPFRLSARALTGALRCAPLPNTTTASAPTAAVTEGAVPRSRSPHRNAAGQVLRGRWERPGRGVRAHGALIPSAHSPFPAQTALECRRGTEQRAPCPPSRPAGSRLTVAAPSAGSTGRRRPSAWRELAPLGPAPRPPLRLPGERRDGRLRSAAGHACGGDPPHLRGVGCGRRPRSASPPSAGISRRSERGHRAACAGSAARQTTPRAEKGGMKTEKKNNNKKRNLAARNLKRGTLGRADTEAPCSRPGSSLRGPPPPTGSSPTPARCGTRTPGRGCQGPRGQGCSSRLEFSSPRANRPGRRLGLSPSPFLPAGRGAKRLQVRTARGSPAVSTAS